jgi:hypothetical protein
MAAKPMLARTKALRPYSYSPGWQQAAISVLDFRKPTTKEFGGGKGVIVIANASGPPLPQKKIAGAGILYVQDGALKYMGSNGTVTVLAPS